ncbi:hypothetical protein H6F67_17295 [Microcoleus sp. FACHB-1515]|uniref:hypothetical protein n=1 Tax=Cyanophyceae TaxID=3028117 RepID=UPI001681D659|nr:hypothetical protein [Microcoleus sp. FACHB-1515]MBD2091601.1 hypothetical protein [Microcoleus sp. FACHB-1515]
MIEVTRVEQELADLERQLQQSFRVFDELVQVQQQFVGLTQTHRRLEESIDRHNVALAKLQPQLDSRLEAIEAKLHSELAPLQTEQKTFDRRLSEMEQQIQALRQELEQRSHIMLEAHERQQDAIAAALNELEIRLQSELDRQIESIKPTAIPPTYVEKLDVALRNTRSNLRTVEKQIGSLQVWLTLVSFGALVALVMSFTPGLFGTR